MKSKASGGIIRFTIILSFLVGINMLTSCVLWVPTPRPPRNVVIIGEGHSDNSNHKYYKHNNGNGNGNRNGNGNGRGNGNGKHKNRH